MNRYVKKPIAIEAVKWKGFNNDEIKDFAGDSVKIEVIREGDADNGIPPSVDCSIETLEGVMKANVGDYIIKGVNGEFYPCKQDIFEKTYLHEDDMGNVSDGYHTFNELYKYRMLYNAAFFNELAKGDIKVCKSYKHYDGEECFGGGRTGEARRDEGLLPSIGTTLSLPLLDSYHENFSHRHKIHIPNKDQLLYNYRLIHNHHPNLHNFHLKPEYVIQICK